MSTKNIVLIVVCCVCAFFVYKNFIAKPPPTSLMYEKAKCELIGEWLKKKSVSETAFYGFNETLTTILNDYGINVNNSVTNMPDAPAAGDMNQGGVPPPMSNDPYNSAAMESQLVPFFSKVKKSKIKSLVFIDGFSPKANIEDLANYLKSGGVIYFREYPNELNENVALHQLILDYLKKGQICIVIPKVPEGEVSSMSSKNRVLAENHIFDDSNAPAFDAWHKEAAKLKAEFQNQPH